jgi:(p)ppGpp synthase/HD superfamily hydrolase
MSSSNGPALEADHRLLLEAVSFAGRAHHHQLRKDKQTPYASHVFRVALIVRHVFGIDDDNILMAAILHDTVEDTTTDFDALTQRFGPEVAKWVSFLSKDKRMPEENREAAYCKILSISPWQVKLCKLADVYDNVMDSASFNPDQRAKTLQRVGMYLDALKSPDLPEMVKKAWDRVKRLVAETKIV